MLNTQEGPIKQVGHNKLAKLGGNKLEQLPWVHPVSTQYLGLLRWCVLYSGVGA